jgi:hypothetical protein
MLLLLIIIIGVFVGNRMSQEFGKPQGSITFSTLPTELKFAIAAIGIVLAFGFITIK